MLFAEYIWQFLIWSEAGNSHLYSWFLNHCKPEHRKADPNSSPLFPEAEHIPLHPDFLVCLYPGRFEASLAQARRSQRCSVSTMLHRPHVPLEVLRTTAPCSRLRQIPMVDLLACDRRGAPTGIDAGVLVATHRRRRPELHPGKRWVVQPQWTTPSALGASLPSYCSPSSTERSPWS